MRKILSTRTEGKIIGFGMTEADFKSKCDCDAGLCLACGHENGSCEPDAREYVCEECEEEKVFGMEELMIMGKIKIE